MRFINSGMNLQFTAKKHGDIGWVVAVMNEDDFAVRLGTVTVPHPHGELTADQFNEACTRWLNKHDNEELAALREQARGDEQRMRGFHAGTTPFGDEIESQLDEIARVFGRNDVYLGTKQWMGRQMFVLAPWLRGLTGDRYYHNASLTYVLGFIGRAHAKATAPDVQPNEWQQLRLGQLPVGAMWVAEQSARGRGLDSVGVRVVDVGSIGNGGHVVTWTDQKTGFYVTEDYNNIDIFRS